MEYTQKTQNKNSSSTDMGQWVTLSIIGHLFILVFILICGQGMSTGNVNSPLVKKNLEEEKQRFQVRNQHKLSSKLDKMTQAYNDLVEVRNKQVKQYQQFEKEMQNKIPDRLFGEQAQIENEQAILAHRQHEMNKNIADLEHIREEMKESINKKDLQNAVQKAEQMIEKIKNIRNNYKLSLEEVESTLISLNELEDIVAWMNNDALIKEIKIIKNEQQQLYQNLKSAEIQFKKYDKNISRNRAKISELQKDTDSAWKRWLLQRHLKNMSKQTPSKEQAEERAEKQKRIKEKLESNLIKANEELAQKGLVSTPFVQRDKIDRQNNTRSTEGLLNQAKGLKQQSSQMFNEARAAELALLQSRAFNSAMDDINTSEAPFPEQNNKRQFREDLDLNDPNQYQQAFEVQAQDMDLILAEIQAMRKKAAESGTSFSEDGLTNVRSQIRQRTENKENLLRLAGPRGEQAQDLSQDMFMAMNPTAPKPTSQILDSHPPNISLTNSSFGRKIASYGKAVNWFYVDSWYMIGPFDNPRRRYIEEPFPPESIIDLDAEYTGKSGRIVQWQFLSSPTHFVKPIDYVEYGIYYCYTELYVEQAGSLWMAFGSDDRLDVWIENIKVWQSSNNLKQWNPGEGLRKVYLKQGYNKILARLENGYRECGFSVLVCAK